MRNAFARAMTELAQERDDVCLLSGDIGNRMFDCYKEVAPARFFNCGIAEANMMSLAAGMGLCGMRPVVYTIAPFTTIRCLEQIKIGVAYHESPVVIVGTGSGLSYSELGRYTSFSGRYGSFKSNSKYRHFSAIRQPSAGSTT